MRVFLHRNRWYLLAACFLFFGARSVFLHNSPERLREMDLPGGPPLCIRDNICYFSEGEIALRHPKHLTDPAYVVGMFGSRSFSIRALPVFGGSERTLVEDPRQNTIFHRLHVGENAITYLAYPESQAQSLTWQSSAPGSPLKRTHSLFFARASLHSASFAGGDPVDILPGQQFTIATNFRGAIGVTRDKVYWIEVDPTRKPYTACASLKVVSRSGGEPETLMAGISPQSSLTIEEKNEEKIWVLVPAGEDNASGRNIYCLDVTDDSSLLFLAKSDASWYTFLPVTLADRVYWKRSELLPARRRTYREEVLSAKLDGSDLRVIGSILTSQPSFLLYAHKGALYTDRYLQASPRHGTSGHALIRIATDMPEKAREVFQFPIGAGMPVFEGDYFYYMLDEERKHLWNWSQKSLMPLLSRTLCRYRLPD